MRQIILVILVLSFFSLPANAMDFTAPDAPEEIADVVEQQADSFGAGLWNVIRFGIGHFDASLADAMGVCLSAAAAAMVCALLREAGTSMSAKAVDLACAVAVAGILLEPSASLIRLGTDTARELSEYGKLLIPVMTGAMAAQGGVTASASLYAGTMVFDSLLSQILARLMVPLLWIFLAVSVGNSALNEPLLGKMRDFIGWCAGWVLKIVLYLFTGYMTVTGVVSGSADAAAVRATKAAISTAVPVVGGILSDASEAVLVTAGTLGSAAGVYGMLTVLALFIGPFVRLGVQYLLLKGTGALCAAFDGGGAAWLVNDFGTAMGLVLGIAGTQTVLLMISCLCLMKGVG